MKALLTLMALALIATTSAFAQNKAPEVRRVVTALDANGRAVPLTSLRSPNPAGEMWVTSQYPPDYSWKEDRAKTKVGLIPPANGTIFRIVDFPPMKADVEKMDLNTMMKVVGDPALKKRFASIGFDPTPLSSEAANEIVRKTGAEWRATIKRLGVKLD